MEVLFNYVGRDYRSNKLRAIAEIFGMLCGVGAAILLAATTPNPAMLECYIIWLVASGIMCICSISRNSTGMALSYFLYFLIDGFGLIRTVL